ncbi:MAG TPA: hypothetical protein PK014_05465 [Thermoanaerobaculia bacterium]|nr:hypothetical protein [Thermoanaerobaculia bacterium]HUM28727.1 hypothetical protein [Thermoanaerobaculia bacterium]HXK68023.1 hypothetical protein [Thermoanaerobaculia bacterium]
MIRFVAAVLIAMFMILSSAYAEDPSFSEHVQVLKELRDSCNFPELIAKAEAFHDQYPDAYAYTEMVIVYSLRSGDFERARATKDSLINKYGADPGFKENLEQLSILFAFYESERFEYASQVRPGVKLTPFALEAVILSSILSGSTERFDACDRFQKIPYYCLLARKSEGTYVPLNMSYDAGLPSMVLDYVNGKTKRADLDKDLDSCLADLPVFRKLLTRVLDRISGPEKSHP